ncbi:MAG: hypothetical protein WCX95_03310 [Candidatus Gracilibacteria bacterium]
MTESAQFPREFPSWGHEIKTYSPKRIGDGTRMQIYRSTDGKQVLRVPLYTESQLVTRTGGSGVLASEGDPSSEISNDTVSDIDRYTTAKGYVGKNTVGVLPMYFPDQNGNWRTYSLQRYVPKKMDLGELWYRGDSLSETERKRIRRMIEDIRELITETGLIFDLCGSGNTVIDDKGFPRIIDVNMIQPLIPNDEVLTQDFKDPQLEHDVIMAARLDWRGRLRKMLNPQFFSMNGLPIGDWSIRRLQEWETQLGMQTRQSTEKDELYSKYINPLRDEIINGIRNDLFPSF